MIVPVTVENFVRAETDSYFTTYATGHGRRLGAFPFRRDVSPIDDQTIVRHNRDTLYGGAIFDLDAGPVTITLPDPGDRFMSLQTWNQNQNTPGVHYGGGTVRLTREEVGTRYVLVAMRILVNSTDPADVQKGRDLEDAIKVDQPGGPGTFEVPDWDPESHKRVRDAVMVLAETVPDSNRMFGMPDEVDPIRFLCGAAALWGGNRREDAIYINVVPEKNDGQTMYRLKVGDVPVDGFWSITLYNADGYMVANDLDAYAFNNLTVQRDADRTATIQFGGCDGSVRNCPDHARLELHRPALPPAQGDPRRQPDLPEGRGGGVSERVKCRRGANADNRDRAVRMLSCSVPPQQLALLAVTA